MKKTDAKKIRDEFQAAIDHVATSIDKVSKAGVPASSVKLVASSSFLAAVVLWDSFVTDLLVALVNRDSSQFSIYAQRRLQQQNANFAQLRDILRFHYSIKYLIDEHMSVDTVSKSLDFSDRTSFTNAFKRWTSLSPSVFRKLFRDYA